MKVLKDLIPTDDQLKLAHGVEGDLLRRRQIGKISGALALAWAIIQILISAKAETLKSLGGFVENLAKGRWSELAQGISIYEFIGILVLVILLGIYFVSKWTNLLLKESKEPFRYTFWIEVFSEVGNTSGSTSDNRFNAKDRERFNLLAHDLREMLDRRIGRFSLLNVEKLPLEDQKSLKSHIHVRGDFAVREEREGKWVFHVMPYVRIGSSGSPETIAYPVKYPLDKDSEAKEIMFNADRYNQIVERVYSSIATEIYRQIESDVKEKIKLFPTEYMRSVALFHEAEDFARSNTIDAYDRAIKLYEEAGRYFDVHVADGLTDAGFILMQARVKIGHAKCLIYKRLISALSGRYANPLFEIPGELTDVIKNLTVLYDRLNPKWRLESVKGDDEETRKRKRLDTLMTFLTFPKYDWPGFKPPKSLFEDQTRLLFDANVVNALVHYYLDAFGRARRYLDDAKAVDPVRSERDALYLLAWGEYEPDIDKEIPYFRQATEVSEDFQIAQYLLANSYNMRFRRDNEIAKERAKSVIEEYDNVLKINPGNIASIAAQGYIYWLLKDFDKAKSKFKDGREIKAVVRETFIGELNYGLARIAAEEGRFNDSYDLYMQAVSIDPGMGAYSVKASRQGITAYYGYIGTEMLKRYEQFKTEVEKKIENAVFQFYRSDLKDSKSLINKLRGREDSMSRSIFKYLPAGTQEFLKMYDGSQGRTEVLEKALIEELNRLIQSENICEQSFISGGLSVGEINRLLQGKSCLREKGSDEIKLKGGTSIPIHRRSPGDYSIVNNRLTLERVYSKEIIKSIDDSGAFNNRRKVYDQGTNEMLEEVSESTLDVVYRFVLNDYGNACLNYFHRFGYKDNKLEAAIEVFERAGKEVPTKETTYHNLEKVANYNLANAYDWKGVQRDKEYREKQIECLKKTVELGPLWNIAVIASAQAKLNPIQEWIDEQIRKINEKKKQNEGAKQRKTVTASSPVGQQQSDNTPALFTTEERVEMQNKIVKELTKELEEEPKKKAKNVLPEIEKILEKTRLWSMYDVWELNADDKGIDNLRRGVDNLLSSKIEIYRLDENDIEALKILAEVLSFSFADDDAYKAAEELCKYILKQYYPDNYNVNMILQNMYRNYLLKPESST